MYKKLTNLEMREIEKLTGYKVRGNFITKRIEGSINKIKVCIPVDPKLILDDDTRDIFKKYLKAFSLALGPNDRYVVGMEITYHFGFFCIHIAFLNNLVGYERTNLILAEIITGINTFGEKEINYVKDQAVAKVVGNLDIEEFNEYVKPVMNDKKIFFIVEHNNPDFVLDVEVNDEFNFSKDINPLVENTGYLVGDEDETIQMWLFMMAIVFIFNLKNTSTYLLKDNRLLIAVKSLLPINEIGSLLRTVMSEMKDDESRSTFINSLLTSYISDEEEIRNREPHLFIEKYLLFDTPFIYDPSEFSKLMLDTYFNQDLLEKFVSLIDEKIISIDDRDDEEESYRPN